MVGDGDGWKTVPVSETIAAVTGGHRAIATAELPQVESCCTLIWRRQLRFPCATVFAALTEPARLERWMEGRVRADLRTGGRFLVDLGEGLIDGVVLELRPPECFAYSWGSSIVRASVAASKQDPGSSELNLAHHGLAVDHAASIGAGWEAFLDQLSDYLEGKELEPARQRVEHRSDLVRLYQRYLSDTLRR